VLSGACSYLDVHKSLRQSKARERKPALSLLSLPLSLSLVVLSPSIDRTYNNVLGQHRFSNSS